MAMDNLVKKFKSSETTPDPALSERLWQGVLRYEAKRVRIKFWSFLSAALVSFAGIIEAAKVLQNDFSRSGFYSYISLLVGGQNALAYWKELSLSILESLPVFSMAITLSFMLVCFLSLRYLIRTINRRELIATIG